MSGRRLDSKESDIYCAENHTGPLCKVCTDQLDYYFDESDNICKRCPPMSKIVLQALAVLVSAAVILPFGYCLSKHLSTLSLIILSLGLQTKLKVLVGFY